MYSNQLNYRTFISYSKSYFQLLLFTNQRRYCVIASANINAFFIRCNLSLKKSEKKYFTLRLSSLIATFVVSKPRMNTT